MPTSNFRRPHILQRLRSGLAAPYLGGFLRWLEFFGCSRGTIREYVRAVEHFDRWTIMRGSSVSLGELDETALETFCRHLPWCRCAARVVGSRRARAGVAARVERFIDYLRERGVAVPFVSDPPPLAAPPLIEVFNKWMTVHRGVRSTTLRSYLPHLRHMLATLGDDPALFDAQRLRDFLLAYQEGHGRGVAQAAVPAIRMFLRFLIAEGRCHAGLDQAIPPVAKWRLAALPRHLTASEVERLLATCDVASPVGCRDRAILLLLCRMGLRGGDVIHLRLSDLDWRGGTIRVAGKGRHEARLPLPQEVGDALLTYLEHGRPSNPTKHVFLRVVPPFTSLSAAAAVSAVVAKAISRAGVVTRYHGAHVLRHSAATEMLRQGATLQQIGAVLRHRSTDTTTLYAKVDATLLRAVAQPWPEEVS